MTVMRRRSGPSRVALGAALLVASLALLVLAGPAQARQQSAAAPPSKSCSAKRSVTVAAGAQARIYARTLRGSDEHRLIGCLLGSGRTTLLETWSSCDCSRGDESGPQVWLRGTVVAINRYSCPPSPELGSCGGHAHTFDLRTRRTLREAETGSSVAQLVLGPRGSFAYVSSGGTVESSDADGEAVLDPGPGVELDSLAIAGSLVYWTRDGVPHSARLRP